MVMSLACLRKLPDKAVYVREEQALQVGLLTFPGRRGTPPAAARRRWRLGACGRARANRPPPLQHERHPGGLVAPRCAAALRPLSTACATLDQSMASPSSIPSTISSPSRHRAARNEISRIRLIPVQICFGLADPPCRTRRGTRARRRRPLVTGLLKVRVVRGINLAYRDARGSDPYVVLRLGKKKLKTSVKKRSVNPIWHEELTLTVTDPSQTLKLEVLDKDTFSRDDPMGDADIDVAPLMEVVTMNPDAIKNGTIIKSVRPSIRNCLADESHVCWRNGRFVQDMILRLKNVESGEIQLQLQWVNIPGAK